MAVQHRASSKEFSLGAGAEAQGAKSRVGYPQILFLTEFRPLIFTTALAHVFFF